MHFGSVDIEDGGFKDVDLGSAGIGLQGNLFFGGYYDSVGVVGGCNIFVANGEFTECLSFVIVGCSSGWGDEFEGVITIGGPAIIYGVFVGAECVGKFEAHAIGVGMIVCDGSSFQRG